MSFIDLSVPLALSAAPATASVRIFAVDFCLSTASLTVNTLIMYAMVSWGLPDATVPPSPVSLGVSFGVYGKAAVKPSFFDVYGLMAPAVDEGLEAPRGGEPAAGTPGETSPARMVPSRPPTISLRHPQPAPPP